VLACEKDIADRLRFNEEEHGEHSSGKGKMFQVIGSLLIWGFGFPVALQAPSPPDGTVIEICDILRDPVSFNGKEVAIRGVFRDTDEGAWLVGECPVPLSTGGYVWNSHIYLISPRSKFVLRSVEYSEDSAAFEVLASRLKDRKDPIRDKAIVTVFGKIETREDLEAQVYRDRDGRVRPAGFGHMGGAPAQLVLKTVRDISVVPFAQRPRQRR
jgi:hypothetical protein